MAYPGPRLEDALAQQGAGKLPEDDDQEDVLQERHSDSLHSDDEEASEGMQMEDQLEDALIDGEEGEDDEGLEDLGEPGSEDARKALLGDLQVLLDKKRAEEGGARGKTDLEGLSAHERRVLRMAERARKLEEENMGQKQWFMRGEAKAGRAAFPCSSS